MVARSGKDNASPEYPVWGTRIDGTEIEMLLDSMKVVSFCHVLQGPACTQYLGDMGAQVTKIEPLGGERARRWAGADMGPLVDKARTHEATILRTLAAPEKVALKRLLGKLARGV